MKVLFAVSNESISESIIKKYQQMYKEIILSKNVYYFNAIIKELQKDKTYDRIIISEDLEPFTNSNYETIDNFIFEKLDNISDEAATNSGDDIPIILITTDRRTKSDNVLIKLFGIGVYNALLGQDRRIEELCKLIQKPRTKKEAKVYYNIDSGDVDYKPENESDVSETEIQNILTHYKRLGRNEERYVESFDNIASQYTDEQLKIIIRFLPLNVKAVLEGNSPKYQQLISFSGNKNSKNNYQAKKVRKSSVDKAINNNGIKIESISSGETKLTRPVIIPSANTVKKVQTENYIPSTKVAPVRSQKTQEIQETQYKSNIQENTFDGINNVSPIEEIEEIKEMEEPKRGRGRPRKNPVPEVTTSEEPKRGRGRPKKNSIVEEEAIIPGFEEEENDIISNFEEEENIIPGFEDYEDMNFEQNEEENSDIPEIEDYEEDYEDETFIPGFDDNEEETIIPGFEEEENDDTSENEYYEEENEDEDEDETFIPGFEEDDEESIIPGFEDSTTIPNIEEETSSIWNQEDSISNTNTQNYNSNLETYQKSSTNIQTLLTRDKKIVAFLGTHKNGTSFLINNLAEMLSNEGIKTAILDLTQNKNSYYIYTKNEEKLREKSFNCINRLIEGSAEGITVNNNLDVYTALPGENNNIDDCQSVLETLIKNYSLILLDCDFSTNSEYLTQAQEIYLVQSMDVLTIQPLTAYLRDLKAKGILQPNKLKAVINKYTKVRGVSEKAIIGGMAFYNDPAMSFMTDLFNRETITYTIIPFDIQVYTKYLEGLVNCNITLNGYSKDFITYLKKLANMVYPLVGNNMDANKTKYSNPKYNKFATSQFSNDINSTLDKMKKNY